MTDDWVVVVMMIQMKTIRQL